MQRFKVIHDTVHGSVRVGGVILDLLDAPEVQRLSGIRQLGLSNLVFPGANHTRLEHSLGTAWVARKIARTLELPKTEMDILSAAALLHDVGHGPFSHTLESVLHHSLGVNHIDLSRRVIRGEDTTSPESDGNGVAAVLEAHGLDPAEVAEIAAGVSPLSSCSLLDFVPSARQRPSVQGYLSQIVHGPLDADQIDFLVRDAHYTGVTHGGIDMDRLINTMALHRGDLVVHEKGVPAVEGMFVARSLMYSSVYFHKTVRIAELMLSRAVEDALGSGAKEVQCMTDCELLSWLSRAGEHQRCTVERLKYRRLMKRAYGLTLSELTPERRERLLELARHEPLRKAEEEICAMAGIPSGSVVIDVPQPELLLTEPRITSTEVRVLTQNGVKRFSRLSPFANALSARNISRWVLMVATDREKIPVVQKVCARVLFK